jgi:hypothetical protein
MSDSQTRPNTPANSVGGSAQASTPLQVNNNNAATSSDTQPGADPQETNTESQANAGSQAGDTSGNPDDAAEGSEQTEVTFVADYLWPKEEEEAKKGD